MKALNIEATGKGFALVDVSYGYNIAEPEKFSSFQLEPVANLLNEGHLNVELALSFKSQSNDAPNSNMVVCEIALPSGFVVNADSLVALKQTTELIKRVETKNDNTVAIIYLDHLSHDVVKFKIDAFRDQEVSEQKPTPVIIYDYYNNGKRSHSVAFVIFLSYLS